MSPAQLLSIFVARWWVVALVFAVTVAATAAVTAVLPRTYTASTTLVVEPKFTDVLGVTSLSAQMAAQTFLATQVDILRSRRVAERVVAALGIPQSPVAVQQWREATGGEGRIESYFAETLLKRLDVKPSRESLVLTITFSAADPHFAKSVADAFAQAYIDINLDLRIAPARQYATWFNEQLKDLRANLEAAQARLSAFQLRSGIVGTDDRFDIETTRLAELSSQLALVQGQSVDARTRATGAEAARDSLPDVATTPILQNLRAELVRAEAKLQEIEQSLGPAHPTRQRAAAEVESLRRSVDEELRHASGTVASVARVSRMREAELRAAVAAQKQRVLDLKRQKDEMAVLSREVENAQRIYELALQRYAANSLESQTTQASAYVLAAATLPSGPSSPRATMNLVISALLGLILGLATALLLEFADRRVRSAGDVAALLQLPVLGTLRRVAGPRRSGSTPRLPRIARAGA